MRIVVDRSCFLETSTHLQETKLKAVVLLSRVEFYLNRRVNNAVVATYKYSTSPTDSLPC
jgi:hypothetical protein